MRSSVEKHVKEAQVEVIDNKMRTFFSEYDSDLPNTVDLLTCFVSLWTISSVFFSKTHDSEAFSAMVTLRSFAQPCMVAMCASVAPNCRRQCRPLAIIQLASVSTNVNLSV